MPLLIRPTGLRSRLHPRRGTEHFGAQTPTVATKTVSWERILGKFSQSGAVFSLDIYNYHKSYRNGGYIDGQDSYHR
jgi:hypothetical protein